MKIYRFDHEVSVPVSDGGSHYRVSGLTAPGADACVQVVQMEAGGLIGRDEAAADLLFAAVAGAGWVSGREGGRRGLRPGYAAFWDSGETREAGTAGGMTLICIEGSFRVNAVAVTKDIVVSDYNSAWPGWFEEIRDYIWPAIVDVAIRVDHVGSTSVPGLAAKPIIDLDIVVPTEHDVGPATERLTDLGYRWRGDLGVPGREAFAPPSHVKLPTHHLYLVVKDNRAHMDHWLLRDLLRNDPKSRDEYSTLKRQNVELAQGDIEVYLARKAGFVAGLLQRARQERGLPAVTYWEPDA
jgi:GrpB-like predicted nucleotidyltransferase (UPF0157 family)